MESREDRQAERQARQEAYGIRKQEELHANFGLLLPPGVAKHVYDINQNHERIISGTFTDETGFTWHKQDSVLEADPSEVEKVKAELLKIPLYHATPSFFDGDILPSTEAKTETGNTFVLDRSLDLDQCTFMHWGPFRYARYGNNGFLIDPMLLLNERTFVTPYDIMAVAGYDEDGTFIGDTELDYIMDERRQIAISTSYFSRLVSGPQWLDITARKLLNGKTKDMMSQFGFQLGGEIKHYGAIPRSSIIGEVHSQEQLDALAQTYQKSIEQTCGTSIPYEEIKPPPLWQGL
jgi:hypothetical protein